MSCRQYTCGNCWNEAEGRCLSCAPHLGQELLSAPFPDLDAGGFAAIGTADEANGQSCENGHDEAAPLEALAWPTSDLMREEEEAPPRSPSPSRCDGRDRRRRDGADRSMARLAALGVDAPAAGDTETSRRRSRPKPQG